MAQISIEINRNPRNSHKIHSLPNTEKEEGMKPSSALSLFLP